MKDARTQSHLGAPPRAWTITEAKAKLSEIMRRADDEGPQRIGARRCYVLVTEAEWQRHVRDERPPMGRWLVDHIEPGEPLEPPSRQDPYRPDPFSSSGWRVPR